MSLEPPCINPIMKRQADKQLSKDNWEQKEKASSGGQGSVSCN